MQKTSKFLKSQIEYLNHENDVEFGFVAGVGTGKSKVGSLWVVRKAISGHKFFVGSQSMENTKNVQFAAIVEWLNFLNYKEGRDYKYNRSETKITFPSGGELRGVAATKLDGVTGATEFSGCWYDEAYLWNDYAKKRIVERCRGIDKKTGKAIIPTYRYTGTPPLTPTGWFYEWLISNPTKFIQASAEEARGKWLSDEYLDTIIRQNGGPDCEECKIQVFGELPSQCSRLCVFNRQHIPHKIDMSMGVDLAGAGADANWIVISDGLSIHYNNGWTEDIGCRATAQKIADLAKEHDVKNIRIDATGIYGSAVAEEAQLLLPNTNIDVINFGERKGIEDKEAFANARAEGYFNLADVWNDNWGNIFLTERNATEYELTATGHKKIIDKKKIKERIGNKSPDGLDALMLCLYENYKDPDKCYVSRNASLAMAEMLNTYIL